MRLGATTWCNALCSTALSLAGACTFPQEVSLGSDADPPSAPRPPVASGGAAAGGAGGTGGAAGLVDAGTLTGGAGTAAAPAAPVRPNPAAACKMSVGNQGNWVMSSPSVQSMEAGRGGLLKTGTYYLVRLVRHGGASLCFDSTYAIAQTLELSDSGGQVVSDDISRRRWASRFTYAVSGNTIQLEQSCSESSADPNRAPFGPFDTYTAEDDLLWLFSSSCNYRAEYAYYGPPVLWR